MYAGRLHIARASYENLCTLTLFLSFSLFHFVRDTMYDERWTCLYAHTNVCYVCQTQKEYARVCVYDSLFHIFFEKVSCIRKNFFLRWLSFRCDLINDLDTKIFNAIRTDNFHISIEFQAEISVFSSTNFTNGRQFYERIYVHANGNDYKCFYRVKIHGKRNGGSIFIILCSRNYLFFSFDAYC